MLCAFVLTSEGFTTNFSVPIVKALPKILAERLLFDTSDIEAAAKKIPAMLRQAGHHDQNIPSLGVFVLASFASGRKLEIDVNRTTQLIQQDIIAAVPNAIQKELERVLSDRSFVWILQSEDVFSLF